MSPWPHRDRVTLPERLSALDEVLSAGAERLPDDLADRVRAMLDRSGERHDLSVEHTVVALGGATGSGKSSLFNVIAAMEISHVGVRRPTTSDPMACVWGTQGVVPLLDWLDVPSRRRVARESVLDSGAADDLDGLVLVDLPDHDSTEQAHRATVDRLVELVDLFVWVLDPQKYADAAMHERYLRTLSSHQAVTVVVLNQIDRLPRSDVAACLGDLRDLLDDDGLDQVPVVALSAATGEGVDTLVDHIRTAVTKRRSVDERIEAEARMNAELVADSLGAGEPGDPDGTPRTALVGTVTEALGADVIAESAGRSYLAQARRATSWPVARWIARLRGAAPSTSTGPELPSVPRARSDAAIRQFGDTAAGTLAGPWRDSIRAEASQTADLFPGALESAVDASGVVTEPRPAWWRVINAVQWLSLLTALGGGLWALASAGESSLSFDVPDPRLGGLAVAWLMAMGGVAVGLILGLVGLVAARRGARERTAEVEQVLSELVERTVDEVVVRPVAAEVSRYRTFRRALDRARS